VFHDALGSSSSSAPHALSSTSPPRFVSSSSSTNDGDLVTEIDPESTIDPYYSAPRLKERIERVLRVRGIRDIQTKETSSSSSSYTTTNNNNDTNRKTNAAQIAICSTIVDTFPHEKLWRKWMDETGGEITIPTMTNNKHNTDGGAAIVDADATTTNDDTIVITTSAEMYIHAKFQSTNDSWVQSKTLPISHKPNWNDVRIVRAILSLIQTALQNVHTTHILLCTESCIPIATLKETVRSILLDEVCPWEEEGAAITTTTTTTLSNQSKKEEDNQHQSKKIDWDRSYVNYYNRNSPQCTRFDEHNCWEVLRSSMSLDIVHKALPGWCLLSRKHAQSIMDIPHQLLHGMNLWPAFTHVWAPEEVYIPTALALCGKLDGVSCRALTYSKWDTRAKDHKDRAHPLSYDDNFDNELVSRARAEGCLFLRKMKRSLDLAVWERIVIQRSRSGPDSGIAAAAGKMQESRESRREVENPHSRVIQHDQRRSHDYNRHDRRKRDGDNDSNLDYRRKRRHW
jgi:hypothetical protein